MVIDLSNIIFSDQDDVVPLSGMERIVNTGIANSLGGNDVITGTRTPEWEEGFMNTGTFNTDSGNDIITGTGNYGIVNDYGATLGTGQGNDIIQGNEIASLSSLGILNSGKVDTGNGEDSIISQGRLINFGEVFLGDNNDLLIANAESRDFAIANRGIIDTGDGSDMITSTGDIYNFNFIGTGNGDDIISSTNAIYNEGVINTGNGADSIIVDGVDQTGFGYGIYNNGGAINMGDDNDSIIANEGFESGPNSSGAWFLGEGDDYIKGYGSGDFYGGNGNDTLELTPGTYTVGIWDRVVFAKGNSLMLASEFEKLKAGGTTYDFASLTAGQIIVVA